jgi:hypothetical protein
MANIQITNGRRLQKKAGKNKPRITPIGVVTGINRPMWLLKLSRNMFIF